MIEHDSASDYYVRIMFTTFKVQSLLGWEVGDV